MATTEVSVGKLFDRTREQSKEHFGTLWKAAAVSYALSFGVYAIGYIILVVGGGGIGNGKTGEQNGIAAFVAIAFMALAGLLAIILWFGKIYLAVSLVEHGEGTRWTAIFRYFKKPVRFLYYLLVTVVLSIAIGFGFLFFFIPGVYLAVAWTAVLPVLIASEEQEGESPDMFQAMSISRKAIHPKWFTWFGWGLVKWLLSLSCMFLVPIIWVVPILLVAPGVEWAILFSTDRIRGDLEKAESDEKH